jgi:hypothetical protein
MGVSRRICSENKVEIRTLKKKTIRILKLQEGYPSMNLDRRMSLTVKLNEIMERVEMLRRDKNANNRIKEFEKDKDADYQFTYVLKKENVKNRKL